MKFSKFCKKFRDRKNICNWSIRSIPTWKSIFRGSDMEISISTFLKDFLKEKVPISHLRKFQDFLQKSKISKFWWFFRDRNNICNGSIRSTPTWKSIFRGSDMQISILPGSPKSVSVTHYPLSDHRDSVIVRKIFFFTSDNQPMDRVCTNF